MPEVRDSILLSIKKLNNVAAEDSSFDDDFILYINSALSDLDQLGVGPHNGFEIEGEDDVWEDLLGEGYLPLFNRVKTYIGLHVRLAFDPPATSFAISMMQDQLKEKGWRIVVAQEDLEAEEAE